MRRQAVRGAFLATLLIVGLLCSADARAQEQWPCFMHDAKHSGMAMAVGPGVPDLQWVFQTNGQFSCSPVIDAEGRIYVGSDNFYCLNPDGSEAFRFSALDDISSTAAVAEDQGVFFGSYDHNFYWLRLDGELVAKFDTGAYNDGPPTIGTDGSIYFGSRSESFYAFRSDGTLNWSYDAYDWIASAPAISDDGSIYVGADDRQLYAFAPFGKLKWSYSGYDWIGGSPAIGPDEMVYVPCWDNTMTCLQPSNGEIFWQYTALDDIRSSPAVYADGSIYFGSYDKYLYCLRPEGKTKWSFNVGSEVYSSCALDLDGNCYFGALDGRLYSLDSDGNLRWTFETGSEIIASPAISENGTLYFGDMNGYFYALGGGSSDYTPRVGLHLNDTTYSVGETMRGFYYIINPMPSTLDVDVYLALWTGRELLYYPTFSQVPCVFETGVAVKPRSTRRSQSLFDFAFYPGFSLSNGRWFIALTRAGTYELLGEINFTDWAFES